MLAPILSALALNEMRRSAQRAARSFVLSILMGIIGAVALGFLVAAGFIALARELGPVSACLIFALVFGLMAVVLFAVKAAQQRPRAAAPAMLGALGGTAAGAAAAPDRPARRRSFLPGGPKVLLIPAAAFVAALFVARR